MIENDVLMHNFLYYAAYGKYKWSMPMFLSSTNRIRFLRQIQPHNLVVGGSTHIYMTMNLVCPDYITWRMPWHNLMELMLMCQPLSVHRSSNSYFMSDGTLFAWHKVSSSHYFYLKQSYHCRTIPTLSCSSALVFLRLFSDNDDDTRRQLVEADVSNQLVTVKNVMVDMKICYYSFLAL